MFLDDGREGLWRVQEPVKEFDPFLHSAREATLDEETTAKMKRFRRFIDQTRMCSDI